MSWLDYQISLYELKEAEELASVNWKEIQYLYSKIEHLKNMLKEAGLPIPDEYYVNKLRGTKIRSEKGAEILENRHQVYESAKAAHPERWNGRRTRDWSMPENGNCQDSCQ